MKHTLLCLLLAGGSIAHAQISFLQAFNTTDPCTESWSSLGPYASEYGTPNIDRGRIDAIWVNPNDSNSILAAADGQPGVSLAQITDSIQKLTDPADTAEGGAQDQLNTFRKIWQGRVTTNDSSG